MYPQRIKEWPMEDFPEQIKRFLPLSPAVFHILLALSDGPKHGYGIMQEADRISQGKIKMGPGTLYGTIKRMLRDHLIEEVDEQPPSESGDERRRYYRLTQTGRKILSVEAERLASLMQVVREKVPLRKNGTTTGYQGGT
jgi:DNA-binding PadR family transcriptional regulator